MDKRTGRTGRTAISPLILYVCAREPLFPLCFERHDLTRIAPHGPGDTASDAVGGGLERVIGEVGVTRRRRGVAVSQRGADQYQALAGGGAGGCEAVTQIVQPHVIEPCLPAQTTPRLLQGDVVLARHRARQDVGVALDP